MNDLVRFVIPGEPVGKGRPRVVQRNGFTHTYTPEKTASFENLVKLCYNDQANRLQFDPEAELAIRIEAMFSIPKSASKRVKDMMRLGIIRPKKKPDLDNVLKAVADALNEIAYHDDSQIVYVEATKKYSEQPETIVTIWEL